MPEEDELEEEPMRPEAKYTRSGRADDEEEGTQEHARMEAYMRNKEGDNIEEGEQAPQQKRKKKRPTTAKAPAGPGGMRLSKSTKRPPSARVHKKGEEGPHDRANEVRQQ